VATGVSFSAFTLMFLACLIESGSRFNKTSISNGRSKLLRRCSLRASLLNGSAVLSVAPFFHMVSTMEFRSATSWILHVDSDVRLQHYR
jgi:hypothetical protein